MANQKIFIGVAWPYVNGSIHVGHLAGCYIPADIFARFKRLTGAGVVMVSGTDCHGTPITIEADKEKLKPIDIVNKYDPKVRELNRLYSISYDLFTSTLTDNHKKITQEFFINLLKNGYILKKKSKQYFSEVENKFLADRYVEGECPHCHAKDQRADQCENCGRTLNFGELINPVSKLTKTPITFKETEHYYIDFKKLENKLKEYALNHENIWKDWVFKETLGWINEGLEERPITRDMDWGVEIPVDRIPQKDRIENIQNKRFYVWFDAVIGYFSAAFELLGEEKFKLFWQNNDCKHYYFVGQDNLTFHTIFWPGQIIGQNKEYNLPFNVSVNKFLNLEGKKFSKSRNIIIDPFEVAQKFSVDAVRFYLISILPENHEANWQWSEFKNLVNSVLVGNIGNFIHRVLTFFNNKLYAFEQTEIPTDSEILRKIKETFDFVNVNLNNCKFSSSFNKIAELVTEGNRYFDHNKPWELIKTNKFKAEEIIFNCLQIVYALRILIEPFLPDASKRLSKFLYLEELHPIVYLDGYTFKPVGTANVQINKTVKPLFKKIEETC